MVFSVAVKLIKLKFEGLCACNFKRFLTVRDLLMRCLIWGVNHLGKFDDFEVCLGINVSHASVITLSKASQELSRWREFKQVLKSMSHRWSSKPFQSAGEKLCELEELEERGDFRWNEWSRMVK